MSYLRTTFESDTYKEINKLEPTNFSQTLWTIINLKYMLKEKIILNIITATLFLNSCEGPVGPDGVNTLVETLKENPGTNCENGGIKVSIGIDNNGNSTLDSDEIQSTNYACNGIDGNTSLTTITTEPAGTNCEHGGMKVESGVDSNSSGVLDSEEISTVAFVCNGVDGNQSLTKITTEEAGIICETGGIKVESGLDSNSNSILDLEEVTSSEYVCNGDFDKLVRIHLGEFQITTKMDNWQISSGSYRLYNFNKLDYSGVDSITFVPSLVTTDASTKCMVQLYNTTEDVAIAGTDLETNSIDFVFVESDNIFEF